MTVPLSKGVAWAMRRPDGSPIVLALLGQELHIKHGNDVWRAGVYMDEDEAEAYATRMTSELELNDKAVLIAGPAVYEYPAAGGVEAARDAMLEALGVTYPTSEILPI